MPKYTSDTIIQLDEKTVAPGEEFELADDHPLVKSGRVVAVKKAAAKAAAGSIEASA